MPGTRAQSLGRGVGGSSSTADGNLPAAVPSHELTTDSVLASEQGNREMAEVQTWAINVVFMWLTPISGILEHLVVVPLLIERK